MVTRTIIYCRAIATSTKGGAEFQRNEQQRAAIAAAIANGCAVRRDKDGEPSLIDSAPMHEPISGSDRILKEIITVLRPEDTFVTASLGTIADQPSALVARLAKIVGTGCKIVIADQPHFDFQLIRSIALQFLPLEERCEALSTELDAFYCNRAEQMRQYAHDAKRAVVDELLRRGVDIVDWLPEPAGQRPKKEGDPVRGRRIRDIRQSLELSGSEVGALVEKINEGKGMDKATVSQIETGKCTDDAKVDLLETALRAEIARRKIDRKANQQVAKSLNGSGPPLTAVEAKLFPEASNG